MFVADHIADIYVMVQENIQKAPNTATRIGKAKSIPCVSFCLTNPRGRIISFDDRPIRIEYLWASLAWNLAGRSDLGTILPYNPNSVRFTDDGESFYGSNWGERINDELYTIIKHLKSYPLSRRAIVTCYENDDHDQIDEGSDISCLVSIGLHINEGKLDMHVYMRSQSWTGVMPYDIFLLTMYQELIANEMALELGNYYQTTMDMHDYSTARISQERKEMFPLMWNSRQAASKELSQILMQRESFMDLHNASVN